MQVTSLGRILLVVGAAALFVLERARPLRPRRDPTRLRVARNAAVGLVTAVTVALAERPVTSRLTRAAGERGWGLVPRLRLPGALADAAAVVLMDYTLYLWHVLLHRVPLLWRCHAAHHADLDLDASTALRFHALEFLASVPWRAAQIALIGVRPRALALWQTLTAAEVLFHHSNLRLPARVERVLTLAVVTPRLHGLHHSVVNEERDSNFSSGLTLWDRLHGTWRPYSPDERVSIGLPACRDPSRLTLGPTLAFPLAPEGACRDRANPGTPVAREAEVRPVTAAGDGRWPS